jgi:predicted dehydrogenase
MEMSEHSSSRRQQGDFRVGLIGYGVAGAVFHAPLIATTPGLRLSDVVTSNPSRAEQARQRYPGVVVHSVPGDLWTRADDIDLVVVASPNDTHVPLALAALTADLPVVVDKPLCASVAQGRQLIEAAKQRRKLLSVFQNRRWDGDFLTLWHLLATGALGEPLRFESRFERWRPEPKPGWRRHGGGEGSGGILYDLGSHLIDQALVLFGPVSTVYAELEKRYEGSEVDDDSFLALQHVSGPRSHLWMSSVAPQLGPRLRLLGSKAAYCKFGLDPQEDSLRAGISPAQAGWGREPPDLWGILGAGEDLGPCETIAGAYPRFYQGIVAALRGDAPPPVNAADALAVLEIIEAARRSASRGQMVSLPES